MKNNRPNFIAFIGGLAMLGVGLFWLFSSVRVTTAFFSVGLRIGNFNMQNGMVVVPFVVAVILLFLKPDSLWRKIFAGLTLLIIVAAIIYSTSFHLVSMSLFNWIIILIFTFGGLALVCRELFGKK